jgi:hypothetical protein
VNVAFIFGIGIFVIVQVVRKYLGDSKDSDNKDNR